MKLSVIIPAYNEEGRLPNTLKEIDEYLRKQDYQSEIVVVSDGSKDRTGEVTKEMMREIKNLRLIDNKENHGKGYVVRQGMLEGKGDYRLFTDADNSTSIDHIERMWPLFEKDYDVVIGTRDSRDDKEAKQAVPQPAWKRFLGDLGNIGVQVVAVWGIWDTQCGFKAFTRKAAENIFKKCKIDRWAFDVEALALARKLGYKIGIIPVYWINAPESRVKFKGYVRFLKELLQIKWNLIFRKYGKYT